MRAILLTLLAVLVGQLTHGQIPEMTVKKSSKDHKLGISNMEINIDIVGNIATTTYDIVFFNTFPTVMEGELSMPLSQGQEICRYALDINGKLREGVVVEKVKARQTFEAIVRQNIDPGIAHITKGNFFKTQVYPIPANGTKRVALAICETLTGDEDNLYYSLPIEGAKDIKTFKLDVKVAKGKQEQKNIKHDFENIEFDTRGDAYYLSMERKDFSSNTPLKFTIPRFSNAPSDKSTGEIKFLADTPVSFSLPYAGQQNHQIFTHQLDEQTYFYLLSEAPELKQEAKQTPQKILLCWDNSSSAQRRNIEKELKLLEEYLSSIKEKKEISLITFNITKTEHPKFVIKHNASNLINYIKDLKYDGATNITKVLRKGYDEILIFSDAINTIGEEPSEINEQPELNTPICAISSASGSNYSLLKRMAAQTNGEFIDLSTTSVNDALNVMLKNEEKFLSCTYEENEIEQVFPCTPSRVDGFIEISGILKTDDASITVNYGYGTTITKKQVFRINKATSASVARVWASKKIEALTMDYDKNKKEIEALGSRFNIVTKNTAFIVLDRVEDYFTYNIPPPDDLKEEYNRLFKNREKRNAKEEESNKWIEPNNIARVDRLKLWYDNPLDEQDNLKIRGNSSFNSTQDNVMYFEEEAIDEVIIVSDDSDVDPLPVVNDEVFLFAEEMDMEVVGYGAYPQSRRSKSVASQATQSSIKVLAWQPKAPYIDELRHAKADEIEAIYFKHKKENHNRPSFYIQVADFLFQNFKSPSSDDKLSLKMNDMGVRILSNVIELDLENPELLKTVARRLVSEEKFDLAIMIYEEIKNLRPEEPQSYRDLALAYEKNKQYQEALDCFQHIMENNWNRFEDIKDVVINEMNTLISLHKDELSISSIPLLYIASMPLDVRITLEWSSNDNDIDLWVIDPNGEKCYYQNTRTKLGGKITKDFTQGYGPEEFSVKKAKRGTYTVYVNYYSESRQSITGPVTVYATLYTHYGTKEQQEKQIAVQLTDNKETRQIGQLEFE